MTHKFIKLAEALNFHLNEQKSIKEWIELAGEEFTYPTRNTMGNYLNVLTTMGFVRRKEHSSRIDVSFTPIKEIPYKTGINLEDTEETNITKCGAV